MRRGTREGAVLELVALDYVWLVLLGLAAGASGGLLGIGGSLVMIPGMVLLFGAERQHLYQAAAMFVNFFVVAPAVIRHYKARATMASVVRWTIPCGIVGALAGVYVSELSIFRGSGQGFLQIGFALFLGYVVVYNVRRLLARWRAGSMGFAGASVTGGGQAAASNPADETVPTKLSKPLLIGVVGLPTGMLGGLLGIGGGLYAVPTQQVGLGIPLRRAIANSATTILFLSVFGAIAKNAALGNHGYTVWQSMTLAACLVPSAMIGSWYTSAKVHQWPVAIIRLAFVILLLYCGTRVFLAGWGQVFP